MKSILGVGPKLAKTIVQIRKHAGNLYPDSLGVIMRRPLDREDMLMLDFRPNPRLFAETLEEGD
ncbi:hypothetical protein DPMN_169456 [Dreissena polymorpha]|uniref:Uncharacterized protein n=1 Tax=Dreissena polymorpha TaxID=45954 RepID=A0A9D4IC95_DREPO|nr:hypothetical protein DPMN_169456 [Dreissena polymorpha]